MLDLSKPRYEITSRNFRADPFVRARRPKLPASNKTSFKEVETSFTIFADQLELHALSNRQQQVTSSDQSGKIGKFQLRIEVLVLKISLLFFSSPTFDQSNLIRLVSRSIAK